MKQLIDVFLLFDFLADQFKTRKICNSVVSENPLFIVYCPDKYKIQRMCDEAVHDSIAALKLAPDWFVTIKIIKKLFTALYADENILYFNEDSGNVVCSCNEIGILNIDLNNINLDNNFDEDDPDTIIRITYLAWHIRFFKKNGNTELQELFRNIQSSTCL